MRLFRAIGRPDRAHVIRALTLAIFVLPLATDAKFRSRSPLASLSETVDAQIASELAIWAVGALAIAALIGPLILGFKMPRMAGARYAVAISALVVLGTALALPAAVIVVRGIQTLAVLLVVVACMPLSVDTARGLLLRSGSVLIWAVVAFFAITLITPQLSIFTDISYFGDRRFKLLDMHPIATANLLTLTVVINAWVLLSGAYRLPIASVWFRTAAAVLASGGVLLTRSRGAIFGAAVALAIVALVAARDSSSLRVRISVRVFALTLGVAAVLSAGVITRFLLRGEGVSSILTLNSRTDLLRAVIDVWKDSIWFGYGHLSGRTALLDRFGAGESHNLFNEALLSYGLLGVAFLGAGLVGALVRARRLHVRRSPFSSLFLALLVVLFSQGLVGDGFLGAPGLELTTFALLILVGWLRPLVHSGASGRLGSPAPSAGRT